MFSKTSKKIALVALLAAVTSFPVVAVALQSSNDIPNSLRTQAGSTAARNLLVRADEVLNSITYTVYSTENVWNPSKGIYEVVCAGMLNHMLREALPRHYDAIRNHYGKSRLGIWDYYAYFTSIKSSSETKGGWKRRFQVRYLRPGDLIVWKNKPESTSVAWGHGMIVASVPERDTRWPNVWRVRIVDSTRSPHGKYDSRGKGTGVGAGWMLFKVHKDTGRPTHFAWSTSGIFRNDAWFVMARPV